ncbi:hypothetical protein [Streptomyces reniochalinae]|uniref:hypothetical protein n=1 Tax=Streptomyces reniochalinae TaxID=2250578 RepID=UPI0015F006CA|nr:hypothetical protein [Streptomyces reniochalinae]
MSHPSADDMREYISGTAKLASEASTDDPQHGLYHESINAALDQMDREGGPSYGQH